MPGLITPNYGQMGTEHLPAGNGPAIPYGSTPTSGGSAVVSTASMQGPQDSAYSNTGYRPEAGRADRLAANIVGSNGVGRF
jgi:hypothetical protein